MWPRAWPCYRLEMHVDRGCFGDRSSTDFVRGGVGDREDSWLWWHSVRLRVYGASQGAWRVSVA